MPQALQYEELLIKRTVNKKNIFLHIHWEWLAPVCPLVLVEKVVLEHTVVVRSLK